MHPIIWLCRGIDSGFCVSVMLQTAGESPAGSTGKAQVQPAMWEPTGETGKTQQQKVGRQSCVC